MFIPTPINPQNDRTAREDRVTLVDSSVVFVPRANLAAAKELYAMRRAAERLVTARAAEQPTPLRAKAS